MHVKKGIISGQCNACGAKNELDNAHRLAAFIIKNPPKNLSETGGAGEPSKENGKEKGKKSSGKTKKKEV